MANNPTTSDILTELNKLMVKYTAGLVTSQQVATQRGILESMLRTIELTEIEARLSELEKIAKG